LDNHKPAGDEIDSLRTGPNAWLVVYEDERYEDTIRKFGPNSAVQIIAEASRRAENARFLDVFLQFWEVGRNSPVAL
jgi:hypothetical protein